MPFKEMSGEQAWLLPPSLEEPVAPDHPARSVAEFVYALGQKGRAELDVHMEGAPLGAPASHIRVLLSVWLYGFMIGVRWCRKPETTCR